MGNRITFSTLQANFASQGNYSAGLADVGGLGVGIYVGVAGDVEIIPKNSAAVLYTAVPQGTFMQVPLFTGIGSNTTSTDLTLAVIKTPYV